MPQATARDQQEFKERYEGCPIDCPMYSGHIVATLSDFFAVFYALLEPNSVFWFRGHSRVAYKLAPSALRYDMLEKRNAALELVAEMRRFLEMKLARPPAADDDLGWTQIAQHHGLPTRLLDWTQNAAVALYFACNKHVDSDGLVAILNPLELNQSIDARRPRIFNSQNDAKIIKPYFEMDGEVNPRGARTIGIKPILNTERIERQQGVFTLHGSRHFELDREQARSLLYVPILKEHKISLLSELERLGVSEMFVFPEPEHICSHLRRAAGL